jgi:hypothetical protein
VKPWRGPLGVFLVLLASYSYFWHSRDWNTATRLMLTYSLVDRGTVRINGLEDHTGDRARIGDRYYTDKQPGLSLLGVPAYAAARHVFGSPPHPVDRKGPEFPYWAGDYWVTLATSGVLTALCGALLTVMATGLGCGPRVAVLVGLAYGLGTPAYVYATLFYGHQATAFLLLASLAAIERSSNSWRWSFLAGLCASYAAVVEIQSGPVSAILGLALVGKVVAGRVKSRALLGFAVGALGPIAVLLGYNVAAFGSPFDMGYFHEDLNQFREVHSADNPLGLGRVKLGLVTALLWGEFRGLFAYAPILILAVPGWVVMAWKRRWNVLIVSLSACACVLLVNLSYPNWTGGWSTGPRFLLPLVPFAMLAVAALISVGGRSVVAVAATLALFGGVSMLLFQGVGGRIPDAEAPAYQHPLREVVWPIWRGDPLPPWKEGSRFERTLGDRALAKRAARLDVEWRWLQFVPFVVAQAVTIGLVVYSSKINIKSQI